MSNSVMFEAKEVGYLQELMEWSVLQQTPLMIIFLFTLVVVVCATYAFRRFQKRVVVEVKKFVGVGLPKQRFRKRDKVLFYGRKVLRQVKSISGQMRSSTASGERVRLKKRQVVLKLARKILRLKRENQPLQLQVKEPPAAYLDPDVIESEQRLPPEVMYVLESIRIFGQFEKPLFLDLCKQLDTIRLEEGQFLFRVGDPDDSIYVVQSGRIRVFIREDCAELPLKDVTKGESVTSLLSFLDVLSSHPSFYKTVSARAVESTVVLRLPLCSFQGVFKSNPEFLVRVVQEIMLRLQRVSFTALYQYLGLTSQLINAGPQMKRMYSIPSVMYKLPTTGLLGPSQSTGARDRHQSAEDSIPIDGSPKKDSIDEERSKVQFSLGDDESDANVLVSSTSFAASAANACHQFAHQSDQNTFSQLDASFGFLPSGALSEDDGDNILHASSMPIAVPRHNSQSKSSKPRDSSHSPVKRVVIDSLDPAYSSASPPQHSSQGGGRRKSMFEVGSSGHRTTGGLLVEQVPVDDDSIDFVQMAVKGFMSHLSIDNEQIIRSSIKIRNVLPGTILTKQESTQDISLLYCLTGSLSVSQRLVDGDKDSLLFVVYPGEIVGGLAVVSGEPSFFTIRARHQTRVAVMSKENFYNVMLAYPQVVIHIANFTVRRLSPFVRQIDFALDWKHVESGRAVYLQGDRSDCTYIVLSGRLRSVIQMEDGKKEVVGEYGKGDLVGIIEVLTQSNRSTTVMAVRDTEVAIMPDGLLNAIKIKYPQVVTRLIHLLGRRILGTWQKGKVHLDNLEHCPSASNFSTVAILAVNDNVPMITFTLELFHSLSAIGPTLTLTSDIIRLTLGASALDPANEFRLSRWLGQQEDHHRVVLYQCDRELTHWTQRCIRQADVILIVAMASEEPSVGKIEKQLETLAVRTQKELILLHREDVCDSPKNTVAWLNMRSWCSSHYHIRCSKRMFTRKAPPKIIDMYRRIMDTEPNIHSDFSRMARFLMGTSIGLVLGGGGARGNAHVGLIKGLQESGIPIDMVGGVSIGSFMGALWCMERDITTFTQKAREFSFKMISVWRQILDLTYPATAMFTGAGFNRLIRDVFQDTQIEDLWLPYFAVTTDITDSCMRIHTHGSLWRYIRGSMSLSGYLPPLCDPIDGHLLLDGGYVNNLPADVMRNTMGAHVIFAFDVGSQDETDLTNYGDTLSGWWLLWKRWNPWTEPVKVPNLPEIQSRLAYVSCVRQLEAVKNSNYCHYIRPPIDKYKTLQFGHFDEIRDVGYCHGKAIFETMKKTGNILPFLSPKQREERSKTMSSCFSLLIRDRKDSFFTDLAEMVCRIKQPEVHEWDEDSDGSEYETHNEDEMTSSYDNSTVREGGPIAGEGHEGKQYDSSPEVVRKRKVLPSAEQ